MFVHWWHFPYVWHIQFVCMCVCVHVCVSVSMCVFVCMCSSFFPLDTFSVCVFSLRHQLHNKQHSLMLLVLSDLLSSCAWPCHISTITSWNTQFHLLYQSAITSILLYRTLLSDIYSFSFLFFLLSFHFDLFNSFYFWDRVSQYSLD